MAALTAEQRRRFGRDGYLVVEDAVEEPVVADLRDAVWESIPEDRSDPDSWVGGGYRTVDPWEAATVDRGAAINRETFAYAEGLVGEDLTGPGEGMTVHLQFPGEYRLAGTHRRRTTGGHLDGYGPGFKERGEVGYFSVATTVYLDEVTAGGGGFTVWPGSHLVAAEYFADHSLESPGHGGTLPAIDDDGGWDSGRPLTDQLRATEVTGGPGTAVFWHNKLVHTAGVNQGDAVRMAAIHRFSREDAGEIKRDAADSPWKYFDGVDGA